MRGTIHPHTLRFNSLINCRLLRAAMTASMLLGVTGCGQTSAPPENFTELEWVPEPTPLETLTARTEKQSASTLGEVSLTAAETTTDRPAKGSAEWLLMEIAHLRSAPMDVIRQPIPGQPGKFEEVRLTEEQIAQEKRSRLKKIVELAMQAVSKTHLDQSSSQLFNSAVHYLVDARVQLALAGDQNQAQLLDENAEALFTRDSTSFAAIDAASHMVELTHTMAQRHAKTDSQWALGFARQARLFAERFPQETNRAAVNLIAAGRLCEQLHLDAEAESCLSVVEQIAPNSPYSEQVAGSLRRLRLPGQVLTDFGGSTFDGSFTSIDRYQGKPVLIAFWASNSEQFRKDIPAIQSVVNQSNGQLQVVGVNLDRDERAVEQFLKETGTDWRHIFYSDPEKRGPRNVIAHYYGVTNVPEYWLVDAKGVVRSLHLAPENLKEQIETALQAQ